MSKDLMDLIPEYARPPEDWEATLKQYGYAPGGYSNYCGHCGQPFHWGDKRAGCCLPCAKEKYLTASLEAKEDERLSDHAAAEEIIESRNKEIKRLHADLATERTSNKCLLESAGGLLAILDRCLPIEAADKNNRAIAAYRATIAESRAT